MGSLGAWEGSQRRAAHRFADVQGAGPTLIDTARQAERSSERTDAGCRPNLVESA
jgi:hypothetical protein